jgi:choline/glycine/proline betaine transport protein
MAHAAADPSERVVTRRLLIFPQVSVPVFATSALLILGFVAVALVYQDVVAASAQGVQDWIAYNLGWFYTAVVAFLPVFALWLAFSGTGGIKLGAPDEAPRYNRLTWFAMLFSAGMGIGLLFWSVAEPVSHYLQPPWGEGGEKPAGALALRLTFFHWGLHAWAIYAVSALGLAIFAFRYALPLSLRSVFYPFIGERIYGPIGHAVDVFAVLGTMFGVATSLGLGVLQVNAGLDYLLGWQAGPLLQVALIAVITAAATTSVGLGMDKGVARLSTLNLIAAAGLLVVVLLLGPTGFLLDGFLQGTGTYLQTIVWQSLWTQAGEDGTWQADWTLFYWGWWISWSPFVGSFIARVSRGRSIREFVVGVLLVPSIAVLFWMTVFGGTGIWVDYNGVANLGQYVDGQVPKMFFALLDALPAATALAAAATVIVMLFFVTSSDSGSLVIDMLTAGGKTDAPRVQRIFWAVIQGVVAATLLLGGGLQALQTAAIASGLPVAVILVVMCAGLQRALSRDRLGEPRGYGLGTQASQT